MSNKDNIPELNANRSTEMRIRPFRGGGAVWVPLGILGQDLENRAAHTQPTSYETLEFPPPPFSDLAAKKSNPFSGYLITSYIRTPTKNKVYLFIAFSDRNNLINRFL